MWVMEDGNKLLSLYIFIFFCWEGLCLYKIVVLGCLMVILVYFNVNVCICEKVLKGFFCMVIFFIWSCLNFFFRGFESSSFSVFLMCMLNCSRVILNWCFGLFLDFVVF